MLTKEEHKKWQKKSAELFRKAGIVITKEEQKKIETADFGLGRFEETGLGVLVYVNTDWRSFSWQGPVVGPMDRARTKVHAMSG